MYILIINTVDYLIVNEKMHIIIPVSTEYIYQSFIRLIDYNDIYIHYIKQCLCY